MRPFLIGVGGVLLLLGIIILLPPVTNLLIPPPSWESVESWRGLGAIPMTVPPDSLATEAKYYIYGRHEVRCMCFDWPEAMREYYWTVRNVRLRISFTELGGNPVNFYILAASSDTVKNLETCELSDTWLNKYKWEREGVKWHQIYEKKGVVSDDSEIPLGGGYAGLTDGLCFVAENPNNRDVTVEFSTTLTWEYISNWDQRKQAEQNIDIIAGLLIIISLPVLALGFLLPSKARR